MPNRQIRSLRRWNGMGRIAAHECTAMMERDISASILGLLERAGRSECTKYREFLVSFRVPAQYCTSTCTAFGW